MDILSVIHPTVLSAFSADSIHSARSAKLASSRLLSICGPALLTDVHLEGHEGGGGGSARLGDIKSLLQMRNLVRVTLDFGLELEDSAIEMMGSAWPRLQILILPSLPGTKLTLRALLSVAQHCSSLEHLEITVNATDLSRAPPSSPPPPGTPCSALRILSVGRSFVGEGSDAIAALLARFYPNLTLLHYDYLPSWKTQQEKEQAQRWERICTLRPLFVAAIGAGFYGTPHPGSIE
ncbi:hypothetical protein EV122DRAFT_285391 [Schizophyllum commune]